MKLKTTVSEPQIRAAIEGAARSLLLGAKVEIEIVNDSVHRIALPGLVISMRNYSVEVAVPATKKVHRYISSVTLEAVGKLEQAFETCGEQTAWETKIADNYRGELQFERREEDTEVLDQEDSK